MLIILDLDETLVHATSQPQNSHWDFEVGKYKVYKRPDLDVFLDELKNHFQVAVWSSASDDYVQAVVKHIFPTGYPLLFVWGRSKCSFHTDNQDLEENGPSDYLSHLHYVKPLKKVWKKKLGTPEQTLIIDDTPRKSKFNFGNAIYPRPFSGNLNDKELLLLLKYVLTLQEIANIRTLEKRKWWEQIGS